MRALAIKNNIGSSAKNTDLENKLNNFYENEFRPLIDKPKFNFTNKSYLNAYIAEHIATAFNNNIKELQFNKSNINTRVNTNIQHLKDIETNIQTKNILNSIVIIHFLKYLLI